ncbi:MAG TPA: PIN domain-containing protein [Anaerolineales bacterium]|jgi:predicted nucleic acid-binding protein|nr:PIN domain-containing protein [Anaerolineales bacterium]HQX17329.1 PIN domain-containing protein [Anaerolineales bacterium]
MKKYVLDTSALMAYLEAEEGSDRVEDVLTAEEVILPFISLMKLYYISLQEQGQTVADERYAAFRRYPVFWQFDEQTTLTAARLKAANRISFADSMIAAIAIQQGAILVHKDPEYDELAGQVEMEALPYKT